MPTYVHYFYNPAQPTGTTDDPFMLGSANSDEVARRFGLPLHFWDELLTHGSDWAFVIQLHALLEAAVNQALATAGQVRRKEDGRASISKKRERLVSLGKLDAELDGFFRVLSGIRNRYAHDVAQVYTSLGAIFTALPDQDIETLILPSTARRPIPRYAIDDARNWPREVLVYGSTHVLAATQAGPSERCDPVTQA